MAQLLLASLTIGLLGSLHCAGMCGPLAVAVSCSAPAASPGGRLGAFVFGKLVTYVLLGVAAATIGSAFGSPRLGERAFAALALVAGGAMAFYGARTLWLRVAPASRLGSPGPVATLLSAALRSRGPAAPFFAGALAGLLPCGLVWAMVARSLTVGGALGGALVMGAFGLGTAPSLVAAGWVSRIATGKARRYGEVAAAAAVLVMGLIGIWRGANAFLSPGSCPAHPNGI